MEQLQQVLRQREEADKILYKVQKQNGHVGENHPPLEKIYNREYLGKEVNDMFAGDRDDLIRRFGSPTSVIPRRGPTLYDVVLDRRKKEYEEMRDNFEEHRNRLIQERNRIVTEHEGVKEEQKMEIIPTPPFTPSVISLKSFNLSVDTPVPFTPPQSVHSLNSEMGKIEKTLPSNLRKFQVAKSAFRSEREKLTRQYNGELGVQSYEPWQMKDYHMVRGIVEEVVDVFLDTHFRKLPPAVNRETAEALVEANLKDWKKTKTLLMKDMAIQLIMEELLLETTSVMARETVEEYIAIYELSKSRTDYKIMKNAEAVATGKTEGREVTDRAYNIITKTYKALQAERQKLPEELWVHSQYLYHLDGDDDDYELDDADVVVLDFHHVTPSDMRQYRTLPTDSKDAARDKQLYRRFQRMEMDYWENVSVTSSELTLSKKCRGVNTCKVLSRHQILAVGTVHGDIVLFDLKTEPLRPIHVVHNQSKHNDPVLNIASSLDGTQLLSVNEGGVLQCWNLSNGPPNAKDTKALGLKFDNSGFLPSDLTLTLSMDVEFNDFKFKAGHLAETGAQTKTGVPTIGTFMPTFSFLGKQSAFLVGMDKGDILVCDLNHPDDITSGLLFPRFRATPEAPNILGQGITGDLYRKHKYPIMLIGFIRNINEMVTVDSKGYINVWKHTEEQVSSYGWFVPEMKYKLDMSKTMYTPTANVSPSVLFTDRDQHGHRRSRQQIATQRKRFEKIIKSLCLNDPWHEEVMEDRGLITQIFPPKEEVANTGGLFHVIVRKLSTDALSSYITRIYKPVKVKATRLIDCHLSDNGQEIVFLLLFPSFSPKEPHLSVVIVDLMARNVKDFRLDISLTELEYQQCLKEDVVSSCISRQYGPTGSSYIFIQLFGSLTVSSLTTGNIVVELAANRMPQNIKSLNPQGKIITACTNNKMILFSYGKHGKTINQIVGLNFVDNNSNQDRRLMNKAMTMWSKHEGIDAVDLRLDVEDYQLDDLQHPYTEMMNLILDCMDAAIQSKEGQYQPEEIQENNETDERNKYLSFVAEFEARQVKTSPRPLTVPESRERNVTTRERAVESRERSLASRRRNSQSKQ